MTTLGVVGDGVTDDTAAIQAAVDSLLFGGTLLFPAGTYLQSDVIVVDRPNVRLQGAPGATIEATADDDVAIILRGRGDAISGFTLTAPAATRRLGSLEHHRIVLQEGAGQSVTANTVNGGPAAGVFVFGATEFTISGNTVTNTRADGIHMTFGATNGTVSRNTVTRPGDDCVAVVSYLGDGAVVSGITQDHNVCTDSYNARGFSVVGGRDILIRDGRVHGTRAAGIYLASEGSYNTYAAQRVHIVRNRISGANIDPAIDHAAIFSFARSGTATSRGEQVTLQNEDIVITGNVIEGTVASRAAILFNNRHHRRVTIERGQISGSTGLVPVEMSGLAAHLYNLRANTFNGAALPDHVADTWRQRAD